MTIAAIQKLNDAFRQTFSGGTVLLTSGVQSLPSDVQARLLRAVATFSDFTNENDPHGEHDFGSCVIAGKTFFWKIDCYDASMEYGSPDPTDPSITKRVLTIMFADEY